MEGAATTLTLTLNQNPDPSPSPSPSPNLNPLNPKPKPNPNQERLHAKHRLEAAAVTAHLNKEKNAMAGVQPAEGAEVG